MANKYSGYSPEQAEQAAFYERVKANNFKGYSAEQAEQISHNQRLMQQQMANKQVAQPTPTPTPTPTVAQPTQPSVPQGETMEQIVQRIADAKKQKAIADYQNAFAQQQSRLDAEKQALVPLYAEQTRQLNVQDAMARKASENSMAMGGLQNSGAMGQAQLAQNVVSQGAMGRLGQQELADRAGIERRLSDATQARDYGIAQAGQAASIESLENQLAQARQAQEWERQDALMAQGYAREDAVRQQGIAREDADLTRSRELETIGQYSGDYQAEINRRNATPDKSDDWLIPYLAQARQGKIVTNEQTQRERNAQAEKIAYERELKRIELEMAARKQQQEEAYRQSQLKIAQQNANTSASKAKTTAQNAISKTKPKADANSLVKGW